MPFIACNHQPLPWGHWNICRALLCVNLIMVLIFCLSVFYKKAIRQANRRTLSGDQQEESIFLFGLCLFSLRTYCKRYIVVCITPCLIRPFWEVQAYRKGIRAPSQLDFFFFPVLSAISLSSVQCLSWRLQDFWTRNSDSNMAAVGMHT